MNTQIGTVELLKPRVYHGSVAVSPGTYPVYFDGFHIFWIMEGAESKLEGGVKKIDEGLFSIEPIHDSITSTSAVVRSNEWTVGQFIDFMLSDPACVEGPSKRLIFSFSAVDLVNAISSL